MKFIPYGHQSLDYSDIGEVIKALRSTWLTQGPKIKEFEDALCEYTGAKYAVCVSSGTAALHIATLAAGIKGEDEVITSPITFVASVNCILYCGGKPVFADVEPDTANIASEDIEHKVTDNTKAIIPIHFAGHPCDLEVIYEIAKENNLLVIEDAAHALGATYKGIKIGSCKYSDMTIFSFHPIKSITTGEGGAVLTNSQDLYEKLLMLRSHGITKDPKKFISKGLTTYNSQLTTAPWFYEMQELGFNYRLTDFQSALGLSQLKKLDNLIEKRREIANTYNYELSPISEIDLPIERPGIESSWHLYCIRLKSKQKRKDIFSKLRNSGLGVQVHYIPVYLQHYYQKLGYVSGICPNAEDFYRKTISIPLYPDMNDRVIKYVISSILKAFETI